MGYLVPAAVLGTGHWRPADGHRRDRANRFADFFNHRPDCQVFALSGGGRGVYAGVVRGI